MLFAATKRYSIFYYTTWLISEVDAGGEVTNDAHSELEIAEYQA
jgi:hypothetical protein